MMQFLLSPLLCISMLVLLGCQLHIILTLKLVVWLIERLEHRISDLEEPVVPEIGLRPSPIPPPPTPVVQTPPGKRLVRTPSMHAHSAVNTPKGGTVREDVVLRYKYENLPEQHPLESILDPFDPDAS